MRLGDPGELALFLGIGGALVTFFLGPIGKAIGRRISGLKGPEATSGLTTGEMTAERVAALEDRIAELEGERTQLEERLDFAERMLTQGSAEARAPGTGRAPA